MKENELSYKIRGDIFKVYNELGPGLLESVYVAALVHELRKENVNVRTEVPGPVWYDGIKLELGFRLYILVEELVVIEVKYVEVLANVHHKQLLTYLKLYNKRSGILVNFITDKISNSIFRKVIGL